VDLGVSARATGAPTDSRSVRAQLLFPSEQTLVPLPSDSRDRSRDGSGGSIGDARCHYDSACFAMTYVRTGKHASIRISHGW